MKINNYLMMIFILFSSLYSINKGYYIYKFGIDSNDSIFFHNSKFVEAKLKVSKIEKHIHDPFIYKLTNQENDLLFESKINNPKIVNYEDFINNPVKSTFILDSTYFIIKIPAFDNVDKIVFYRTHVNSDRVEKMNDVQLHLE